MDLSLPGVGLDTERIVMEVEECPRCKMRFDPLPAKKCGVCGEEFIPRQRNQKYCALPKPCKNEAQKVAKINWWRKNEGRPETPIVEGEVAAVITVADIRIARDAMLKQEKEMEGDSFSVLQAALDKKRETVDNTEVFEPVPVEKSKVEPVVIEDDEIPF